MKRYKTNRKKAFIRIAVDIIPFIFGFIYKQLWEIRLNNLGYVAHFDTNKITISGLWKIFSGNGESYQNITVINFIKSFIGIDRSGINISLISYSMLFFIGYFIIYKLKGQDRKRYFILANTSVMSFLIYSFYMLCLYLFTYSETEAKNLASFERYEYTIIMGIFLVIAMLLITEMSALKLYSGKWYILIFCIFLFIVPNKTRFVIDNSIAIDSSKSFRNSYDIADKLCKQLPEDGKVYIISQNNDGLDYFVLRYCITPIHTQVRENLQSWSDVSWDLGKKDENAQLVRKEIEADDWIEYLIENQFEYVLLYNIDETFVKEYGELFDIKPNNNSIYVVNKENKKLLRYL